MQTEKPFLDDLAKLLNGAAGTLTGAGREFESGARAKATLEDEISFEDEIVFEDEMGAEDDIAAEVA